jgi:lipopolysaccharide biosynthesis protein
MVPIQAQFSVSMSKSLFFRRVKVQLHQWVEIVKLPFCRHFYDWVLARRIAFTLGQVPLGKEVAVYLIFPSQGLLASHVAVLEAMLAEGICPVVVSNLPLSPQDRSKLEKLSHILIERPNIGYDFGGYRDAILHIHALLPRLEKLWILNDSVWMIEQPQSWFSQARALEVDFAASSFARTRRKIQVSEARKFWPPDYQNKFFHYGSFSLAIGPRMLRDKRFLRYWKRLAITSNKRLTVIRGEIALTHLVMASGFSHAVTCDFGPIEAELGVLSSAQLDAAAQDALFMKDDEFGQLRETILATDPDSAEGRRSRIDYLLYLVLKQGAAYALALFAIRNKGFHFMKKAPARLSPISRDRMLQFAASMPNRQGQIIADEIRMLADL